MANPVYAFFARLTKRQKSTYQRSNEIEGIRLPNPIPLQTLAANIQAALASADEAAVTEQANKLTMAICQDLKVRPVKVKVLAKRPSNNRGELHGLYESEHGARTADITVWMRTAKRKQVVAFKTFLRTLLHEICHHLDYDLLKLNDSFHTAGFYKRESSLFKQLVPTPAPK